MARGWRGTLGGPHVVVVPAATGVPCALVGAAPRRARAVLRAGAGRAPALPARAPLVPAHLPGRRARGK